MTWEGTLLITILISNNALQTGTGIVFTGFIKIPTLKCETAQLPFRAKKKKKHCSTQRDYPDDHWKRLGLKCIQRESRCA